MCVLGSTNIYTRSFSISVAARSAGAALREPAPVEPAWSPCLPAVLLASGRPGRPVVAEAFPVVARLFPGLAYLALHALLVMGHRSGTVDHRQQCAGCQPQGRAGGTEEQECDHAPKVPKFNRP